eukprot:CAMPEP_0114115004 /NCGR_PEP_ID=MMETSP0043_2-20121206/3739_1 /TAXON_ID=464988 /ORGANISM="Hemiselmis andersenii, Strain CCMP644" /LENGTH=56 /DNA_ID=CAMNT_0001207241 /DNA_START=191 /DNA_END=357 /DNA_ORIENTATION=-
MTGIDMTIPNLAFLHIAWGSLWTVLLGPWFQRGSFLAPPVLVPSPVTRRVVRGGAP